MNRPWVAAGLVSAAAGFWLANHVVPRFSDHRGHHLFAHDRACAAPLAHPPRHTLLVVVDGLRADAAAGTRAMQRLRSRGSCAITRVGLPSVSRPVYTVISSGVEQARSGVRNNDDTSPAPVDSIWARARAAGRSVEGRSELAWWRELFPAGFDRYHVGLARDDLFAAPFTADLTLVHPVYVDDTSHDHGADSAENRAAVARVDQALTRALDRLDLREDLVVVTADHGHRARGGHGGDAPEILGVLTCAAGRGVRHDATMLQADTRDLAPTVAVLLGVDVPRHACASHDPQPLVDHFADPAALGEGYVRARRDELRAIRGVASAAIGAVVGPMNDPWDALRARGARWQIARGAAVILASLALAFALVRKGFSRAASASAFGFAAAVAGAFVATYALLAGGIDASSLNTRTEFVRHALSAALLALALGVVAHFAARGSLRALRQRFALTTGLTAAANLAHIAAYGWPIGYPLPAPVLYFAPFLLGSLLTMCGLATALSAAAEDAPSHRGNVARAKNPISRAKNRCGRAARRLLRDAP